MDAETVKTGLETSLMKPIVIGEGTKIIKQYPASNTKLNAGNKIFLVTNDTNNYKMLDIKGWSRNDVITYAKLVGIDVSFEGTGYVKSFNIKKDTLLDANIKLEVVLEPKFKEEETTKEE